MEFEYDPHKSETNKLKHGIDFEEAEKLWNDEWALQVPSVFSGEERFLIIGMIRDVGWTAIVTYRDGSIRIISVRRWRENEKRAYDNSKGTG